MDKREEKTEAETRSWIKERQTRVQVEGMRKKGGRCSMEGGLDWHLPAVLSLSSFAGSHGSSSHNENLAITHHSESIHFKLFSPVPFFL